MEDLLKMTIEHDQTFNSDETTIGVGKIKNVSQSKYKSGFWVTIAREGATFQVFYRGNENLTTNSMIQYKCSTEPRLNIEFNRPVYCAKPKDLLDFKKLE